jgi:hypothetical protein
MGCKLEAFILNHQAAEMLPDNLRHLHRCRLSDQLALVPVTRDLYKEVVATFGEARDDPYGDSLFIALHPALSQLAARISSFWPVLYLEVDVASGIGDRTAIVWHKGEAAYGPSWSTDEAFRLFGRLEGLSSDQVAGLDIYRYRFTEDWVRHIENDSD